MVHFILQFNSNFSAIQQTAVLFPLTTPNPYASPIPNSFEIRVPMASSPSTYSRFSSHSISDACSSPCEYSFTSCEFQENIGSSITQNTGDALVSSCLFTLNKGPAITFSTNLEIENSQFIKNNATQCIYGNQMSISFLIKKIHVQIGFRSLDPCLTATMASLLKLLEEQQKWLHLRFFRLLLQLFMYQIQIWPLLFRNFSRIRYFHPLFFSLWKKQAIYASNSIASLYFVTATRNFAGIYCLNSNFQLEKSSIYNNTADFNNCNGCNYNYCSEVCEFRDFCTVCNGNGSTCASGCDGGTTFHIWKVTVRTMEQ